MKTILLYCQNMLGTGHFVRMSLLARGLAKQYKVFLIDGGRPVSGDRPGPGITRVELPRICSRNGKVTPVDSAAELPALMAARRRRLESVCRELQPDAIIVEHFPLGKWFLRDEVLPLIQLARQLNPRMLVLSSIRDLVATNELVPSHLRGDLFLRLLNTSFDGLLIHSDPQFIRLDDHLPWAAEIRVPSYYTGFIREEAQPVLQPPDSTGILVSAGGNGGAQLRRCSIEAWKLLHRAPDVSLENMTILLALHHDQEELQYLKQLVGNCPIRIEPFSAQFVPLLQRTRLSISQAGYNTCANLLATLTRAVLVSHTAMGDQALRVRRFAERGLATVISPDDLTGPSLAEAIRHALLLPAPRHDIDLNGVHRSCDVISQLLSGHGMDSKRISTLL